MARRRSRCALALPFLAALLAAGCGQEADNGKAANKQAPTPIAQAAPKAVPKTVSQAAPVPLGAGFDFYLLALSWSPSYCEAEGADANRQQCGSGRPYAFVVHGLWPQSRSGYPERCRTDEPDVPDETLRALHDLMPSSGLIRYEWRKHGTCAGLEQDDYFAVLRAARERVSIPPEFQRLDAYRTLAPGDAERAFVKANPALPADAVAVICDRRYLREVRICMTKDLKFRSCPELDRRGCRLSKVVMPPVRGG